MIKYLSLIFIVGIIIGYLICWKFWVKRYKKRAEDASDKCEWANEQRVKLAGALREKHLNYLLLKEAEKIFK